MFITGCAGLMDLSTGLNYISTTDDLVGDKTLILQELITAANDAICAYVIESPLYTYTRKLWDQRMNDFRGGVPPCDETPKQ